MYSQEVVEELANLKRLNAQHEQEKRQIRERAFDDATKATEDRNKLHEKINQQQQDLAQKNDEITSLKVTSDRSIEEAARKSELHKRAVEELRIVEQQNQQVIKIKQEARYTVGKKQQRIDELNEELDMKKKNVTYLEQKLKVAMAEKELVVSERKEQMDKMKLGNKKIQCA